MKTTHYQDRYNCGYSYPVSVQISCVEIFTVNFSHLHVVDVHSIVHAVINIASIDCEEVVCYVCLSVSFFILDIPSPIVRVCI